MRPEIPAIPIRFVMAESLPDIGKLSHPARFKALNLTTSDSKFMTI
jgi:hypothetical protein